MMGIDQPLYFVSCFVVFFVHNQKRQQGLLKQQNKKQQPQNETHLRSKSDPSS